MFLSLKKAGVGVDLDTREVRVVELRGKPRSPELSAFGRLPLPEGAVRKGGIIDAQKVGEALSTLWDQNGISTRDVVLGISNQEILVRFANFPKIPQEKLGNLIRLQAQDFLPLPLDKVVFDYLVVGENRDEEKESLEVLLVAARRDMVDGFLSALEAARLIPQDIDVSSLALLRLIPPEDRGKTVAVLHMPYEVGSILIARDGNPRLARFIPVSLTEILGKEFFHETRESIDPITIDWSEESFSYWSDMLTSELRSSIDYYQSQEEDYPVEQINLSGCGIRIEGLAERLQERFDIPVVTIDPLQGISLDQQAEYLLSGRASDFALNISLALRGLEE